MNALALVGGPVCDAACPPVSRFSSDGSSATRCLRSSVERFGCTLQTRSSSVVTPRSTPRSPRRRSGRRASSAPMPVLAQERREERSGPGTPRCAARSPPCATTAAISRRSRWLISSAVVWMFASAAFSSSARNASARRAARRRSRGRRRSCRGSGGRSRRSCGRADRPCPITGDQPRPACASAFTSRRDGCVFFAKNAPSSIAALSTGICSRASSALMPSGRSLVSKMKSNSIATISIVIDSSWFAFCAERRLLQVAQDVVQARRDAGERRPRAPPTSKSGLARPAAASGPRAGRRRDDRRAGDVARRRRRAAARTCASRGGTPGIAGIAGSAGRSPAAAAHRTAGIAGACGMPPARPPDGICGMPGAARRARGSPLAEHALEHRHHVDFGDRPAAAAAASRRFGVAAARVGRAADVDRGAAGARASC